MFEQWRTSARAFFLDIAWAFQLSIQVDVRVRPGYESVNNCAKSQPFFNVKECIRTGTKGCTLH